MFKASSLLNDACKALVQGRPANLVQLEALQDISAKVHEFQYEVSLELARTYLQLFEQHGNEGHLLTALNELNNVLKLDPESAEATVMVEKILLGSPVAVHHAQDLGMMQFTHCM
jgi:hypothetical protein